MDPVLPRRERRFLKVEPLSDSWRVRRADASEFTGAEGLLSHPSPVPLLPEMALREVDFGEGTLTVKAHVKVVGAANNVTSAPRESFIIDCISLCFYCGQKRNGKSMASAEDGRG
jgi:hypothetical protein